ncbi:MAG: hypothetical protein QXY85_03335 [Candidatus Nitrosocaldus sp.]
MIYRKKSIEDGKSLGRDLNPRPSAYEAPTPKAPEDIRAILLLFLNSKRDDFFRYLSQKVNPKLASRYMKEAVKYTEYALAQTDLDNAVALYLKKYENPNSYNNKLKPIIHLYRFLGLPLQVRLKKVNHDNLIIAPSYEQVVAGFRQIKDNIDIARFYLLCSTTLLRPQFIVTLAWSNIDLENKVINVRVDKKTKHYRSQIIHKALIPYLTPSTATTTQIFTHCYDYYQKKIRHSTGLNPSQLRDFAYNAMLKAGMNSLLVEWLMGHSIGMAVHYLADNVKEEYVKFESLYPFVT